MSGFNRLTPLCHVTRSACTALAPMVRAFYTTITGETSKHKADASYFTIADGIVQYLLVNHLYAGDKFAAVVGEEDENNVQIFTSPYKVEDLTVPQEFNSIIDQARLTLDELAQQINGSDYKDVSIFIDPIDGTREFSIGLGEQCSICIGFSDVQGKPIAGMVYRPITEPPTYSMGAASESFVESQLDLATTPNPRGFLTSNGAISPFIAELIKKLGYERVPSGGAGNKMLMLLEGKGAAYIQDRGVSRWDTCGAQAVIEAHGGVLAKMTSFVRGDKDLKHYTYLKSTDNLDFEEGVSNVTPYNVKDKKSIKKGDPARIGTLAEFAPYSNICGLIALSSSGLSQLDTIFDAIQEVKQTQPPSYD